MRFSGLGLLPESHTTEATNVRDDELTPSYINLSNGTAFVVCVFAPSVIMHAILHVQGAGRRPSVTPKTLQINRHFARQRQIAGIETLESGQRMFPKLLARVKNIDL
jgi:hypothetical protein